MKMICPACDFQHDMARYPERWESVMRGNQFSFECQECGSLLAVIVDYEPTFTAIRDHGAGK